MRYQVSYLHQNTGETARFCSMSREDALEVARQLIFDGERDVEIEDENGRPRSVRALEGD